MESYPELRATRTRAAGFGITLVLSLGSLVPSAFGAADDAAVTAGQRAAQQQALKCTVDKSAGFELKGSDWVDAPGPNADVFQLKPVPGRVCKNDDFTCQAKNPNYHLTSDALKGDFVGCYRHAFLPSMTCDVFTSTLKVNFDKGVFSLIDDGGLISGGDPGGNVHLRVGKCVPVKP